METSTPANAPADDFKSPKTMFKLINPGGNPFGGGHEDRFKPAGARAVCLMVPKAGASEATPSPSPAPAQPVQAKTIEMPDSDAKIIARMEYLLKIDKRVSELEEENELLLKMVNRVKAENDTLKAENAALRAK